jgi:hypothetical protein
MSPGSRSFLRSVGLSDAVSLVLPLEYGLFFESDLLFFFFNFATSPRDWA